MQRELKGCKGDLVSVLFRVPVVFAARDRKGIAKGAKGVQGDLVSLLFRVPVVFPASGSSGGSIRGAPEVRPGEQGKGAGQGWNQEGEASLFKLR